MKRQQIIITQKIPKNLDDFVVPLVLERDVEIQKQLNYMSADSFSDIVNYFTKSRSVFEYINSSGERLRYFSSILILFFKIRKNHNIRELYVKLFEKLTTNNNDQSQKKYIYTRLKKNFIKQALWEDKGKFLRFLVDSDIIKLDEIPLKYFMPRRLSQYFRDIFDLDTVPDNIDMLELELKHIGDNNYNEVIHFDGFHRNTIEYSMQVDDILLFRELSANNQEEVISSENIGYCARYGSLTIFKHIFLLSNESVYPLSDAISGGNYEIFHIIFNKNNEYVSSSVNSYDLFAACIKFHRNDIFNWLLENGFSVEHKKEYDLLDIAFKYRNILVSLFFLSRLYNMSDLNQNQNKSRNKSYVKSEENEIIQNKETNENKENSDNKGKDDNENDNNINDTYVNVKSLKKRPKKFIEICAKNGDFNYVKYLLTDINLASLMNAAHNNNFRIVKLLHENGINLHDVFYYYRQSFVEAIENPFCSRKLAQYLIDNNVSMYFNESNKSPYFKEGERKVQSLEGMAAKYGNFKVAEMIKCAKNTAKT